MARQDSSSATRWERDVSAIIGLGANLGPRELTIARALEGLAAEPGVRLERVSRVIETDPVGGPPQPRYRNGIAEVRTRLSAAALLAALQRIEDRLGRERELPNGPRTMDLDLLLYGDEVISEEGLEVPHPRMLEREFVLEPLAECLPERVHPVSGRTIRAHWDAFPAERRH